MRRPFYFSRTVALFLSAALSLPPPCALALRTQNAGLEDNPALHRQLTGALRGSPAPSAGAEEEIVLGRTALNVWELNEELERTMPWGFDYYDGSDDRKNYLGGASVLSSEKPWEGFPMLGSFILKTERTLFDLTVYRGDPAAPKDRNYAVIVGRSAGAEERRPTNKEAASGAGREPVSAPVHPLEKLLPRLNEKKPRAGGRDLLREIVRMAGDEDPVALQAALIGFSTFVGVSPPPFQEPSPAGAAFGERLAHHLRLAQKKAAERAEPEADAAAESEEEATEVPARQRRRPYDQRRVEKGVRVDPKRVLSAIESVGKRASLTPIEIELFCSAYRAENLKEEVWTPLADFLKARGLKNEYLNRVIRDVPVAPASSVKRALRMAEEMRGTKELPWPAVRFLLRVYHARNLMPEPWERLHGFLAERLPDGYPTRVIRKVPAVDFAKVERAMEAIRQQQGERKGLTEAERNDFFDLFHAENLQPAQWVKVLNFLMEQNDPLVLSVLKRNRIARRINANPADLPDLRQAGRMGLREALLGYDPAKGAHLSTYATYRIGRAIKNEEILLHHQARIPHHALPDQTSLEEARQDLLAEGQAPSDEAIARKLNWSLKRVRMARQTFLVAHPTSMDPKMAGRPVGGPAAGDSEEGNAKEALAREAAHRLEALPPRLKIPLKALVGIGMPDGKKATLEEIGNRMKVSKERVRQLTEQAKDNIREAIDRPPLPEEAGSAPAADHPDVFLFWEMGVPFEIRGKNGFVRDHALFGPMAGLGRDNLERIWAALSAGESAGAEEALAGLLKETQQALADPDPDRRYQFMEDLSGRMRKVLAPDRIQGDERLARFVPPLISAILNEPAPGTDAKARRMEEEIRFRAGWILGNTIRRQEALEPIAELLGIPDPSTRVSDPELREDILWSLALLEVEDAAGLERILEILERLLEPDQEPDDAVRGSASLIYKAVTPLFSLAQILWEDPAAEFQGPEKAPFFLSDTLVLLGMDPFGLAKALGSVGAGGITEQRVQAWLAGKEPLPPEIRNSVGVLRRRIALKEFTAAFEPASPLKGFSRNEFDWILWRALRTESDASQAMRLARAAGERIDPKNAAGKHSFLSLLASVRDRFADSPRASSYFNALARELQRPPPPSAGAEEAGRGDLTPGEIADRLRAMNAFSYLLAVTWLGATPRDGKMRSFRQTLEALRTQPSPLRNRLDQAGISLEHILSLYDLGQGPGFVLSRQDQYLVALAPSIFAGLLTLHVAERRGPSDAELLDDVVASSGPILREFGWDPSENLLDVLAALAFIHRARRLAQGQSGLEEAHDLGPEAAFEGALVTGAVRFKGMTARVGGRDLSMRELPELEKDLPELQAQGFFREDRETIAVLLDPARRRPSALQMFDQVEIPAEAVPMGVGRVDLPREIGQAILTFIGRRMTSQDPVFFQKGVVSSEAEVRGWLPEEFRPPREPPARRADGPGADPRDAPVGSGLAPLGPPDRPRHRCGRPAGEGAPLRGLHDPRLPGAGAAPPLRVNPQKFLAKGAGIVLPLM